MNFCNMQCHAFVRTDLCPWKDRSKCTRAFLTARDGMLFKCRVASGHVRVASGHVMFVRTYTVIGAMICS